MAFKTTDSLEGSTGSTRRGAFITTSVLTLIAASAGSAIYRYRSRYPELQQYLAEMADKPEKFKRQVLLAREDHYTSFLNTLPLQHILAHEVIRPHRNIRDGIANCLPPEHLWDNIRQPLLIADEIRRRTESPLRLINSAYRSRAYNARCPGASRSSYHMRNMALDLDFSCGPERAFEVARKLRAEGFFRGGIGRYQDFIHIDSRGDNATW